MSERMEQIQRAKLRAEKMLADAKAGNYITPNHRDGVPAVVKMDNEPTVYCGTKQYFDLEANSLKNSWN